MRVAWLIAVALLALCASSVRAWTPSECPQDCVRPEWWWEQHRPGQGFYWPGSCESNTFPCGGTWLQVIVLPDTDLWTLLAQQFIAARLNLLSFTCIVNLPQNITWAINEAEYQLSNPNYCTVFDNQIASEVLLILQEFNEGNGDVQTCLCNQPTPCPTAPQCPNCPVCPPPPPFSCNQWVIDTCCPTQSPSPSPPAPPAPSPPPSCGPCTRTQGYWKTHTELWTNFTVCKNVWATYLLNTPSAGGDAFIILGRQYVAAVLNLEVLGVCPSTNVNCTINEAADLLHKYCTPTGYTVPLQGARSNFTALATILDLFNSGGIGPGHCDGTEESSRIAAVYADALEKTFSVDQAFSGAATVVPLALSVVLAAAYMLIA